MKTFKLLFALLVMGSLAACATSQKETYEHRTQVVEFTVEEVPYIQATKKNGKMSAEVVTPTANNVTVNK